MITERLTIGQDGKPVASPVWFSNFWKAVEDYGISTDSKLVENEDWSACANRYSNALNISYVVFWVAANDDVCSSWQCFSWKSENDKSRFVEKFS